MPRTKALKKALSKPNNDLERNQLKLQCQKLIENNKKKTLLLIQAIRKDVIDEIRRDLLEERMKVPTKCLKLSVDEVKTITSYKAYETISMMSCFAKEDVINIAKSTKPERKIIKSSSSIDDGYLTTESSSSRNSRTATKGTRKMRASRSLSRNNQNNLLNPKSVSKNCNMETPANKRTPPNSYGVVTPKCKPNTPLVLLRRPKMGEVAISMQGSPLMTTSVATEEQANINIPLGDGTMLSLLPQKGLRMSQIPHLDSDTLKQLSNLSENIKTVVELTEKRYGLNFD